MFFFTKLDVPNLLNTFFLLSHLGKDKTSDGGYGSAQNLGRCPRKGFLHSFSFYVFLYFSCMPFLFDTFLNALTNYVGDNWSLQNNVVVQDFLSFREKIVRGYGSA